MMQSPLPVVGIILFALSCASSEAAKIVEAGLILQTPSAWQKEELQGVDSCVVRYRGEGFTCEIEEGTSLLSAPERAAARIEEIKRMQADGSLCPPGESVVEVGERLGLLTVSNEERFVEYGGFPDLAQLYFPLPGGGYVVVRLFYGTPATRESAVQVLKSAKWERREPDRPPRTKLHERQVSP